MATRWSESSSSAVIDTVSIRPCPHRHFISARFNLLWLAYWVRPGRSSHFNPADRYDPTLLCHLIIHHVLHSGFFFFCSNQFSSLEFDRFLVQNPPAEWNINARRTRAEPESRIFQWFPPDQFTRCGNGIKSCAMSQHSTLSTKFIFGWMEFLWICSLSTGNWHKEKVRSPESPMLLPCQSSQVMRYSAVILSTRSSLSGNALFNKVLFSNHQFGPRLSR